MGDRARQAFARRATAALAAIGAITGTQAAAATAATTKGNGVRDRTLTLKDFKQGQLESKFFTERETSSLLKKLELKIASKIDGISSKFDPASPFAKAADLTAGLAELGGATNSLKLLVEQRQVEQLKIDGLQDSKIAASEHKIASSDLKIASSEQKIAAAEQKIAASDLKIGALQAALGDGSVRTGRLATSDSGSPLVTVEGVVAATPALSSEALSLGIRNLSAGDATVVGTINGAAQAPRVLKAGEETFYPGSNSPRTYVLQVLTGSDGLATLTVSSFMDDRAVQWAGQALAG